MRLSRIKNLLPAPKDASQLYLVVTPTRLQLDKDGNWKDNRNSFAVEVWKQTGDKQPTQSDMGDYTVHICKNGASVPTAIRNNTSSFSVQAAVSDTSFDVRLKVGDAFVQTLTVDVTKDGADGANGTNAVTHYTWIRYADTITFDGEGVATGGTGMSDSPLNQDGSFKEYIGFAYNQTSPTESESYVPYKWTKFRGTDGTNGVNGLNGSDGQSLYTWIKYADSLGRTGYPSTMYDTPTSSTEYIGIAVNKASSTEGTDPRDYSWSKFKGDQGVQGPTGPQGPAGQNYYTWIRYADTITFDSEGAATGGTGMSDSPLNQDGSFKEYIGFAYNQTSPTESESYVPYKWTKFKGTDGTNGVNGLNGSDGQSLYTWIKYADSLGGSGYPSTMYDTPTSNTEYIGIAVNKTTSTEGTDPTAYSWSKFKGDQGVQGPTGPQGPAGQNYYTWIRYADTITFDSEGAATGGTGMSDSPINQDGSFKEYIGFAYNQTSPTESESYGAYKWTKFKGTDGTNGVNGLDGSDGQTLYTWIKYADSLGGSGYPSTMYDTPTSNTEYIGIAVNKTTSTEGTDPTAYSWSKFKGDQGVQGPTGPQGPAGQNYYTWIRYATTITFNGEGAASGGTGMSDSPLNQDGSFKEYIGFAYNKTTPTESESYSDYKWTRFKGTDGEDGIDGANGTDGQSLYTWIKYAVTLNAYGYPTTMYDEPTSDTEYIGIAVNKKFRTESNTPSDYTWSKFKGDQGVPGQDGVSYYTWIRYADRIDFDSYGYAVSGSGMSNSPTDGNGDFKEYIGFAYNKTSPTESNSYGDYKWTKFKGTDGTDGIDGMDGADGQSLYTWIKYADSLGGNGYPSTIYDTPTSSTEYIGIAVNKTVRTESNTPSDYTWSKFKGDQGVQGPTGPTGPTGPGGNGISSVTTYYLATTMETGVTRNTQGWQSTYQQATPDLPYVWRYSDTLLTNGQHTYTDCELVFSYSAGANPNLLDQTNFTSLQAMDKWSPRAAFGGIGSGIDVDDLVDFGSVTTGTQAHNAYYDKTPYGYLTHQYKTILSQVLKSSIVEKVEPSAWYTLSFWCKNIRNDYMYPAVEEKTQAVYGFFRKAVYLRKNQEYTLYANGSVSNPSYDTLYVEIGNTFDDNGTTVWEGHGLRIQSAYSTTNSVTFTAGHTGVFYLSSYSYRSQDVAGGNVTINWYRLVCAAENILEVKLYPGFADTGQPVIVDGVQITLSQNSILAHFGTQASWERHTITFKSAASISGSQALAFMLLSPEADDMEHAVYLCMPKLEVGMQATSYLSSDATLHTGQPRRRRWALDTKYLAGGVDEAYDDVVLYGNTGFYHCIKSHISTVDNAPDGTYGSLYWSSANSAMFELLATDIFFAEKAFINNLIATLIQTGYSGTPHIEAEGSEFKVFGKGQYPAIYLAVNDNNKAVLRFQDENTGEFLYDLGPDGIMKEFSEVADSYTEFRYHKLTSVTRVSELMEITSADCTTYYRFNEGYKQIGSGDNISKEFHVSGGALPSLKNGSFFTNRNHNSSYIPNGWYCEANNGIYMMEMTGVYVVYIYQFSGGKIVSSVPVYFRSVNRSEMMHSVGCDENGSELNKSTYSYLYSYYQSNNLTP